MIRVLTIVYEKHTKTDVALKTKVRNQCWTLLELPNNTKCFGPLLTTGKANYKLPLQNYFSLGTKYISETRFEKPPSSLDILIFMKVTLYCTSYSFIYKIVSLISVNYFIPCIIIYSYKLYLWLKKL